MKGIILAGGTGSRLRPITHTGPKQLVPVANKPVLEYALDDLIEAGIEEIGIVLGNKGRDAIQEYFGDGSSWGIDITYIVQGTPLGLAHAVGCTKDFVGDEPFVVYLGDDLMKEGIVDLVSDFDSNSYAAKIGLQEVEEPSRYGIVETDETGNVVQLVEKPDKPPSNLALIGIYVLTPKIFDQIKDLEFSWRGEYEITEAIQGLLESGHDIQSHIVHGWWKDTGKPEDVLHANRLVLDDFEPALDGIIEDDEQIQGRVEVGAGSIIKEGATVRGPVSIGKKTTIQPGTYIGPYTSIGDECDIANVHIESSVVVGKSTVDCDQTIVDSLIGRKTAITSSQQSKPKGKRLVVGQNSLLEL